MGKKHDEVKDVRLLSRKMSIDTHNKTIVANRNTIIGNNSWGRIDFLVNHCGYIFRWDAKNSVRIPHTIYVDSNGNEVNRKKAKKEAKAPQLTNKKKR